MLRFGSALVFGLQCLGTENGKRDFRSGHQTRISQRLSSLNGRIDEKIKSGEDEASSRD